MLCKNVSQTDTTKLHRCLFYCIFGLVYDTRNLVLNVRYTTFPITNLYWDGYQHPSQLISATFRLRCLWPGHIWVLILKPFSHITCIIMHSLCQNKGRWPSKSKTHLCLKKATMKLKTSYIYMHKTTLNIRVQGTHPDIPYTLYLGVSQVLKCSAWYQKAITQIMWSTAVIRFIQVLD